MADFDPDAYLAAKSAPAAPTSGFDPDAYLAAKEAPAPAAPAPQPSIVDKAKAAARAVAEPFQEIGRSALAANDFVTRAITHPVDTFGSHPAATVREVMRGVNDNIPFANRLVAAIPGAPPAESPEDAALAPGARAAGGFAGMPIAGMEGELAGKAVGALGEKAAALAQQRADAGVYKGLGRATGDAGKAKLEAIGPERIGAVDRQFGISASKDPPAAIRAARAQVGAARDAAFQAISQAGGDVDMAALTTRLDALQADFAGKAGTRPFAADVARLRSQLLQRYGELGEVPAKALADEISAIDEGAYGGNYANPKTAQIVKRRTAGVLRDLQSANLDAVAKMGPDQAAAVQTVRDANQQFAALKTMEPIVKAKTARAAFEPGFFERALDQGVVKTVGHAAKDAAAGAVDKAIAGVGRAAQTAAPASRVGAEWMPGGSPPAPPVQAQRPAVGPAQVARLIQLARTGATRQQLAAQAQADGTPPEIAANIAQQYGR